MKHNDVYVYDHSEPSNCEAWKRLPLDFQEYITSKHNYLRNIVFECLENSKYNPIFTSGFRSHAVNKSVGGVSDSLHLYGLAVDFILVDKMWGNDISPVMYPEIARVCFSDLIRITNLMPNQIPVTLIVEKTHFHLQLER